MTLSGPVIAAVLFAALLHGSWKALVKWGPDKALDTGLVHSIGVLFALVAPWRAGYRLAASAAPFGARGPPSSPAFR